MLILYGLHFVLSTHNILAIIIILLILDTFTQLIVHHAYADMTC